MTDETSSTKVKKPRVIVVPDDGRRQMSALWVLLTGNPDFLLNPVMAAIEGGGGTVELQPAAGDSIQSWGELEEKLQASNTGSGTNSNSPNFTQTNLTALLTNTLAKTAQGESAYPGHEFSTKNTYAAVLYNASLIFQEISGTVVPGWDPPCPKAIDEIPVVGD